MKRLLMVAVVLLLSVAPARADLAWCQDNYVDCLASCSPSYNGPPWQGCRATCEYYYRMCNQSGGMCDIPYGGYCPI